MSAPIIWIVLPLIASVALMVIRKNFRLAALIQFAFCFVLLLILLLSRIGVIETTRLLSVYVDPEWIILGRSFILNEADKFIIGLLYSLLALWSLFLFAFNKASKIIPLGLPFTALLLAAIAVDPFLYSALLVEIAVILSIIILVDIYTGKTKGLKRYLIFITLGMPFILLAGWYLSGGETSPINDEQLLQATILLALGFVFWLAIFPFHSWIPLIAEESEVQDGLYVLTVLPFSIFIIFLKFLNGFAWLRDYELVYQALLLVGVIMVGTGSIWAVFQRGLGKMLGYLTITYTGYMLIALGLNTDQGFLIFSELQFPRVTSYLLLAASLISIGKESDIESVSDLRSVFHEHRFASAGFLISLFSLVGMPLTAGFLPLQALYQAVSKNSSLILGVILAGSGLLTVLFIRLFLDIIHPVEDDFVEIVDKEQLSEKILLSGLALLVLFIGVFPNLVYSQFSQLLSGFEFLVK